MVLPAVLLCSMLATTVLGESERRSEPIISQYGADLNLTRAVGGGPVRFNGVDVIALHRSIEGNLSARFNVLSETPPERPGLSWEPRPSYVGRNGTNIEINSAAGGRVLVDNVDIADIAWRLRAAVDAIKISWLGSSALLPNATCESICPLTCHCTADGSVPGTRASYVLHDGGVLGSGRPWLTRL